MPSEQRALSTVARGAVVVFLGVMAGNLMGYLQKLVIARHLNPGAYGLVTLGLAVVGISATVANLGLVNGIARYIAHHRARGEEAKVRGTLVGALKVSVPLGVLLGGGLYLAAEPVALRVFHDARLTPVLQLFALLVPFSVITNLAIGAIRGFKVARYKVYVADLFQPTAVVALLLVFFALGYDVMGAVYAYVAAGVGMALLAIYLMEGRTYSLRAGGPTEPVMGELVAFSWPLAVSSMMALVVSWTDVLMLGHYARAHAVGLYNVALPTAQLLLIVQNAFNFLFMPSLTEVHAEGGHEEVRDVYRTVARWVFLAAFPVFLVLTLFSAPVLITLFGPAYGPAATTLAVLAFGMFVVTVVGPTGNVLIAVGKPVQNLATSVAAAGSNVALNLYLIPRYGIIGAGAGTAASFVIANALALFLVWREIGAQPFTRAYLRPAAAALASVAAFWTAWQVLDIRFTIPLAVAGMLAYLLVYVVVVALLGGFQREEVEVLKAMEKRVGDRVPPLGILLQRLRALNGG